MTTFLTFDGLFRTARVRAAEREIAARPAIPRPKFARRWLDRSTPPVSGFFGEVLWAVVLMLLLAAGVRMMVVFATLQGARPAVHVDETTVATQPAPTAGGNTASRAQPSSEAASRTM